MDLYGSEYHLKGNDVHLNVVARRGVCTLIKNKNRGKKSNGTIDNQSYFLRYNVRMVCSSLLRFENAAKWSSI